jgi:hypothetical protein
MVRRLMMVLLVVAVLSAAATMAAVLVAADEPDLIGSWICCERVIPGCICVPLEGDWPEPPCPDGYVTVPGTTTYPAFCAVVVVQ